MESPLLLQKIQERFPNQLPKTEVSTYELGTLVGQQEVIEFIKSLLLVYDDEELINK